MLVHCMPHATHALPYLPTHSREAVDMANVVGTYLAAVLWCMRKRERLHVTVTRSLP